MLNVSSCTVLHPAVLSLWSSLLAPLYLRPPTSSRRPPTILPSFYLRPLAILLSSSHSPAPSPARQYLGSPRLLRASLGSGLSRHRPCRPGRRRRVASPFDPARAASLHVSRRGAAPRSHIEILLRAHVRGGRAARREDFQLMPTIPQ